MKKDTDTYSDDDAERRFHAAIRHALATPHKPQSELVAKGRQKKKIMKAKPKDAAKK